MSAPLFAVTVEHWAPTEDEMGTEPAPTHEGFLRLADALRAARQATPRMSETRCTEADCSDRRQARSVSSDVELWETGALARVTIHFPRNATPASRARLVKILLRAGW